MCKEFQISNFSQIYLKVHAMRVSLTQRFFQIFSSNPLTCKAISDVRKITLASPPTPPKVQHRFGEEKHINPHYRLHLSFRGDENFFPHFFFTPMMFVRFTIDSCSSSCWNKKSLEGAVVVFHFSSVVDEIFRFPLYKRVPGRELGKFLFHFIPAENSILISGNTC